MQDQNNYVYELGCIQTLNVENFRTGENAEMGKVTQMF